MSDLGSKKVTKLFEDRLKFLSKDRIKELAGFQLLKTKSRESVGEHLKKAKKEDLKNLAGLYLLEFYYNFYTETDLREIYPK